MVPMSRISWRRFNAPDETGANKHALCHRSTEFLGNNTVCCLRLRGIAERREKFTFNFCAINEHFV